MDFVRYIRYDTDTQETKGGFFKKYTVILISRVFLSLHIQISGVVGRRLFQTFTLTCNTLRELEHQLVKVEASPFAAGHTALIVFHDVIFPYNAVVCSRKKRPFFRVPIIWPHQPRKKRLASVRKHINRIKANLHTS